MKNSDVLELLDQTHSVQIDQFFWIAAMFNSHKLLDFFNYDIGFESDDFKELFPWIGCCEDYYDMDELQEKVIENNKLGFVARIIIPRHDNFTFDEDGEVKSGSIHHGILSAAYVYAETTEDLLKFITAKADEIFNRWVEKAKNEQGLTAKQNDDANN